MAVTETDLLLSDEFMEFSGKLRPLHEKKKELRATIQKLVGEVQAVDKEAATLQGEWQEFVNNKIPPKKAASA